MPPKKTREPATKRARLASGKEKSKEKENGNDSDPEYHLNETWTVKELKRHKLLRNHAMEYEIVWDGWDGGNTLQLERSLLDVRPLYAYWSRHLDANDRELRGLARGALVWLSLGKHNCVFVLSDNETTKLTVAPALRRCCQPWQPRRRLRLPPAERRESQRHQLAELTGEVRMRILAESEEYPIIVFAVDAMNPSPDDELPPPAAAWLFRVVLTKDVARKCTPPVELSDSDDDDDDDPEGDAARMRRLADLNEPKELVTPYAVYPTSGGRDSDAVNTHMYKEKIRGTDRLTLRCIRYETFWRLEATAQIDRGTKILNMAGELVPLSAAEACVRSQGETVAFFWMLPLNEYYALDRRSRFDPSVYVEHSCDPNCAVYLEYPYGPTGPPVPFLYAIKTIRADKTLTVDFFAAFKGRKGVGSGKEGDVNSEFSQMERLMLQDYDVVWCQCEAKEGCRGILWKETEIPGVGLASSKSRRLSKATKLDVCGVVVRDAKNGLPTPRKREKEEEKRDREEKKEKEQAGDSSGGDTEKGGEESE